MGIPLLRGRTFTEHDNKGAPRVAVINETMALTLIGLLAGLAGAFALTRVISSLLFRVQAADPSIFIGIALLLAAVSLLASYVPARRAMRVDPIIALRYE